MTNTSVLNNNSSLTGRDRKLAIGFLLFIGIFTLIDIAEDVIEGTTWVHVSVEAVIILIAVTGAIYLWRRASGRLLVNIDQLQIKLEQTLIDNSNFRIENAKLLKSFVEAVEEQFSKWGMSQAESEVAFLLLKGLSVKEIATLRATSEHTVRQQTAAVYQKSKLEGRAQLAAYFLEDLFDR